MKEGEENTEYVEPKVLSEEEHDAYVHICRQAPPLDCSNCPREKRIACMRNHTTETSLNFLPNHMTREEKLRAYWMFIPEFIGVELRAEEKNPLAV